MSTSGLPTHVHLHPYTHVCVLHICKYTDNTHMHIQKIVIMIIQDNSGYY